MMPHFPGSFPSSLVIHFKSLCRILFLHLFIRYWSSSVVYHDHFSFPFIWTKSSSLLVSTTKGVLFSQNSNLDVSPEIQTLICSHLLEYPFECITGMSNSSKVELISSSPYLSERRTEKSHSFPFTWQSWPIDQQFLSILHFILLLHLLSLLLF